MEANGTRTVLVAGDWLIDENWTMEEAGDSPSPAEQPGTHYRSIERQTTLSGAGRVARWLRGDGLGPRVDLVCVGLWPGRELELEHIKRLMAPRCGSTDQPQEAGTERGIRYVNLADFHPADAPLAAGGNYRGDCDYQFFRVGTDGELKLTQRLDWPPRPATSAPSVERKLDVDRLAVALRAAAPVGVEAIVVKCLGRGTVSADLVALLSSTFPARPWFVSSELGARAQWLKKLPKSVRVFFLSWSPLEVDGVASWRARNRQPSYEAIEYLKQLRAQLQGRLEPKRGSIVALRGGLSLIALTCSGANRGGILRFNVDPEDRTMARRIGKASALFAELAFRMWPTEPEKPKTSLGGALKQVNTWRRVQEGTLRAHRSTASESGLGANATRALKVKRQAWELVTRRWDESRRGLGIVDEKTESPHFDLWRGMSAVDGYLALTPRRRAAASQLLRAVNRFAQTASPGRSISCLLMDSPGSGKSALVENLARPVGVEYRHIDLTQIGERADLLHRFDVIVTEQAERPDRRFLIFVDEIDSEEGRWYGQFLAPLEQGHYVRGGCKFRFRPCIWVFAGSTRDAKGQGKKFSDFASRLTLGQIRLSGRPGRLDRLERVYLMIALLSRQLRELTHVTVGALRTFYGLRLDVEVRRLRHLAGEIHELHGGVLRREALAPLRSLGGQAVSAPTSELGDEVAVELALA